MSAVVRAWRGLREFWTVQVELQERLVLLNRPWEEEFLHWSAEDGMLHGSLVPPAGRQRSVSGSGWCPGAGLSSRRGGSAPVRSPATRRPAG